MIKSLFSINNLATASILAGAAAGSILGGPIGGLLGNLFGDMAASTLGNVNYQELLKKPHPSKLNHDLEKTIKGAVVWAVRNIAFLYSEEHTGFDKKELKSNIEHIIKDIEGNITVEKISADEIIRKIDELENPEELLEVLFIEIDKLPDVGGSYPFKTYFREKFAVNYQLCFGELLKKDEKSQVVYSRNVLKNIRLNLEENKEKLEEVNDKLNSIITDWEKKLENNQPIPEISYEFERYYHALRGEIDILVDQNGDIILKLEKIDQRGELHTKHLEKISQTLNKVKITIQKADNNELHLNINNEIKQIPNNFYNFKELLKDINLNVFTLADTLYDVSRLTQESFDYLTQKIQFNQILCQRLILAIKDDSLAAGKFYEKVSTYPNWETESRIIDKAKEIIAYSMVGIVGKEFNKLMAIGKEDNSDHKQTKYVEKCNQLVSDTLNLISFALFTGLWDNVCQGKLTVAENEKEILRKRFETSFEITYTEQLELLNTLLKIYNKAGNIPLLPLPEVEFIQDSLAPGGEIFNICNDLNQLAQKKTDILDCYHAEISLSTFFKYFSFLARYNMVSMKRIGYRQTKARYDEPRYLHRYIAIGIDNKANIDAEKINYVKEPIFTDAVLLYKGDEYKNSINLFPFVIDYNALNFEQGSKICFFHLKPIASNDIEYIFLDDRKTVLLEHKRVMAKKSDANEVFLTNDDFTTYNIDCVIEALNEVQKCIVGINQIDFGDL